LLLFAMKLAMQTTDFVLVASVLGLAGLLHVLDLTSSDETATPKIKYPATDKTRNNS